MKQLLKIMDKEQVQELALKLDELNANHENTISRLEKKLNSKDEELGKQWEELLSLKRIRSNTQKNIDEQNKKIEMLEEALLRKPKDYQTLVEKNIYNEAKAMPLIEKAITLLTDIRDEEITLSEDYYNAEVEVAGTMQDVDVEVELNSSWEYATGYFDELEELLEEMEELTDV